MFLAMLPDSTTPPTIESPTDLWCHIGAAYLPTTAKSERYWSLCSSRSISIRSNSANLDQTHRNPPKKELTSAKNWKDSDAAKQRAPGLVGDKAEARRNRLLSCNARPY